MTTINKEKDKIDKSNKFIEEICESSRMLISHWVSIRENIYNEFQEKESNTFDKILDLDVRMYDLFSIMEQYGLVYLKKKEEITQ